jgi:hypothetical protein
MAALVVGERVRFAGEGGDGGGDFGEVGVEVEAGDRGWAVPGEGLGDGGSRRVGRRR